jgi:hypothetical protein
MLVGSSVARGCECDRLATHLSTRSLHRHEHRNRREGLDCGAKGDQSIRRTECGAHHSPVSNYDHVAAVLRLNDLTPNYLDEHGGGGVNTDRRATRCSGRH